MLAGSNKPRFATAKESDGYGVVWVSLIEKAWAKLCGNYDRVATGTVDMGFIHLCGVPSIGLKHVDFVSQQDKFWKEISAAESNKHIMTAGTSDKA